LEGETISDNVLHLKVERIKNREGEMVNIATIKQIIKEEMEKMKITRKISILKRTTEWLLETEKTLLPGKPLDWMLGMIEVSSKEEADLLKSALQGLKQEDAHFVDYFKKKTKETKNDTMVKKKLKIRE
jgi:hypothetical protein